MLVSDDAKEADEDDDEESPDHNDTAERVLQSSIPIVAIHADAEQGQPPLYVEAYVPIADASGSKHGVVEVYIDQTRTAALFRTTFAALAVGLALVASLAFGLPTLAFLFRGRQVAEARRKVEFLAHFDPMTGVLNRAAFATRLEKALRKAKADRGGLAIVLFDVDDFKSINEAYGQAAGDAFLVHAAHCIESALGPRDICGRQGGDEFLALLAGRSDTEVAGYVEAVMNAMGQPINVDGRPIGGKVSAGVYMIDRNASFSEVLHRVGVALYQAKVDGRNAYRRFSPAVDAAMASRRALEERLRDATSNNGFELYFQPLLFAQTKVCAGFEALLRLPDGAGGMIPPSTFIPVAESIGLINEIGGWVLNEATRIAAEWPSDRFVAVNLSVRQFADGTLVVKVKDALAKTGLSPSQLELEVTESMLIDNAERVVTQLQELKALGVSIAMDDFGTGYSSLGYLWQFGFDKLKIDRSFIAALDADGTRAREVLDTIIVLGHKLDMTVTAEGIETEYQASVLSDLACDHVQGYLYGRPSPPSELAAFLLANRSPAIGPQAVPRRTSA
ncbi:MAG: bifunctional diguanylate cyclase/phosphodiesterase [Devosia sp.]